MDYIENNVEGLIIEIENREETEKEHWARVFIAIRQRTGMNRKEFAEWLGIPYRTMQDWERGVSQVPAYLVRLIAYKVLHENA